MFYISLLWKPCLPIALDGNSYITKWLIDVMYLKNTGRNSTFRAKFFRREVSSSSRSLPTNSQTKSLRSKRRISLVFSTHFHSYQPSFAIIDSINATNYGNYEYRNYKRKVKYFMGYDKGERLKMSRKIILYPENAHSQVKCWA